MKKSNWKIGFSGLGMSAKSILDKIMKNRGVEDIKEFLNPSLTHIYSSHYFESIEKAANLVLNASHILIYADTDTDGCTAASIMYRYLNAYNEDHFMKFTTDLYINKGKDHGIQDYFKCAGYIDTIIIVDSVNDDRKYYDYLISAGKNIIVLDHHIIQPEVLAINSPNFAIVSSANNYPNPQLSGAGVVWKFCRYLDLISNTYYSDSLADLAAVGIIADVCSVGLDAMENRAICNLGFLTLNNPALMQLCKNTEFNSLSVGFNIAPLINAANRMDRNDLALKLFISDDKKEIKSIIDQLSIIRAGQKDLCEKVLPDLIKQCDDQVENNQCLICFTQDNNNLTGLLATRLCDIYKRPVLVLHDCELGYQGSMRATGLDNFSALINDSGCGLALGHENSAGVILYKDQVENFRAYVNDILRDCRFIEGFLIDAEISADQINPFLQDELKHINRITGANFKPIKFCIDNIKNYEIKKLSAGKHLSVNNPSIKCVAWNFSRWDEIDESKDFSAIGMLDENVFMGKRSNQIIVEDFNFADNRIKNEISRNFHRDRVIWF